MPLWVMRDIDGLSIRYVRPVPDDDHETARRLEDLEPGRLVMCSETKPEWWESEYAP